MQDSLSLLPIVGIFLIFYLLVLRPASRRHKAMSQTQRSLTVGDRVLTNSGIFGTVARLEDDRLGLEVADGVVITVARSAIVAVMNDEVEDEDKADPDETPDTAPIEEQ